MRQNLNSIICHLKILSTKKILRYTQNFHTLPSSHHPIFINKKKRFANSISNWMEIFGYKRRCVGVIGIYVCTKAKKNPQITEKFNIIIWIAYVVIDLWFFVDFFVENCSSLWRFFGFEIMCLKYEIKIWFWTNFLC